MRTALPLAGAHPTARTTSPHLARRVARAAACSAVAAGLLAAAVAPAQAATAVAALPAATAATTTQGTDVALDRFGRSLTGGWGTAEVGGAWTSVNAAATFSVSANGGRQRVPVAHTASSFLHSATTTTADVRTDVALDAAPTGGGTYLSVVGRQVGTSSYHARVKVLPNGAVNLQIARSGTSLAATDVAGLSYAPGTKLAVRVQVTGTAPTTIRAKVWRASATEPTTWQVTRTDSTAGLQTAGAVGLTTYVSGTATRPVTATYSDLRVASTAATAGAVVVADVPNVVPTAAATATPTDLSVALSAAGSTDRDGRIVAYAWDNGDGTTTSGAAASHTYPAAGTYPVTLTVTDDRGATATARRDVTVTAPNVAPTAAVAATPTGLTVALDGTRSTDADGTITSYAWAYGDGTTGTGATGTHTYPAAGTYTVALTVTDNRGATARTQRAVTVAAPSNPGARPDDSNTGVPAGTALRVHDGNLTITTPGTVIDGLDIRGRVNVKAAGVTIKNSIVRGGAAATSGASLITVDGDTYSLTLQDSEVFAANPSPYINGIVGRNFTVVRSDIHHVIDQVHIIGNNVRVEASWLHDNLHYAAGVDPNHADGSHDDNIQVQVGSNLTFTGNTITGSHNAAMMITQDRGKVSTVAWTRNWADNGACTINIAEKTYGPVQGVTVTDSTFGRGTRIAGCAVLAKPTTPVTVTNSRYTDGVAVTVKKG
ncbi:PKD domain-containing protein [Cellulomonas aerilata]|uniref:PKD domain-containing protein n=1 Tax=Cellulomonas aerilata TaxID=515326 RepID=UPI0011BFDFC9|nr:PKD domain-containing protein [Cellulomonas aerilata]